MPRMPQEDQSYQIILSPEFAAAIASRDEALNADRVAAGLPPFQHKSPFTTYAEIEKEEKRARRRQKRARARDTAAAKAQIAARCQSNPSFERHARKCAICNHPDCDSIESDFVNWRSEATIALNYQLPSRSSVYRHAAAAGLLERRSANLRGVCERIIERADQAPPSGMAVLRALRIYSQITEDGHWVEPPKHSLVTHVHVTSAEPQSLAGAPSGVHSDVLVAAPSAERLTKEEVAGAPSSAPSAEGGIISASTDSHFACPEACPPGREGREPNAPPLAPTSPCHPEPIRASRGGCEGSAVHDELRNGSTPTASLSVPDLDYVPHWARGLYSDTCRTHTSAQNASPIAPNANGANDLNASRAPEILIGTQNASRENATHGKRGG